jgi:hypothetical protein
MGVGETARLGVSAGVNCTAGTVSFWAGMVAGVGPGGAAVGVVTGVHAAGTATRRSTEMYQRGFT